MRRRMKKTAERMLAVLAVIALIAGMLPVSALAGSEANPNDFTITVKADGAAVSDVTIEYTIKVNGAAAKTGSVTAADGIAVINDMAEYAEQIAVGADTVTIYYKVIKEGFQQAEDERTVTVPNENIDVSLEKTQAEMVTVSVTSQGNGIVKLNGEETASVSVEKGSQVEIVLTPGTAAAYIKSLTIGGNAVNVEKYNAYTGTVTADENLAVNVSFVTEYTVHAAAGKGGSVTLNGKNNNSQTVDEGDGLMVRVTPDEGYQIKAIKIDGQAQTISNGESFEKQITVTGNMEITADFAEVYTVTVECNENGTVKTSPEGVGGKVTVETGTELTVTATPDKNYRVSEVVKNGKTTAYTENNQAYTDKVAGEEKSYSYKITFARNRFQITVRTEGTGTVNHAGGSGTGSFKVNYGDRTEIAIQQEEGWHVESVIVDGTEKVSALAEEAGGKFKLTLESVEADTEIQVAFKENETVEAGDNPLLGDDYEISFSDAKGQTLEALREYTDTVTGQKVIVLAQDAQFKVTPQNGYNHVQVNGKGVPETKAVLAETTEFSSITVSKGNQGYRTPKKITMNVKVVIDNNAPSVELTPAEPNTNGYYNTNVPVEIKTSDENIYSGIAKVEYRITSAGKETLGYTEIYTYTAGAEIQNSRIESITVDADANNSADVKVYVRVTDRAGNTYTTGDGEACSLKICTTRPSVKVSIDGTLHREAEEGYYNAQRTATITITDRADVFDAEAATNAVRIGKDEAEPSVQVNMVSEWTDSGDEHTATVTFAEDGVYNWEMSSYTNKADLTSDAADTEGDSVYTFTVDTTAPATSETADKEKSWIGFEETGWSKLASTLTFGIWKKTAVTITATGKDATSPVYEPKYYKTNIEDSQALDGTALEALYNDGAFREEPYTVSTEEQFAVYARITDYAGNTVYISTDGVIVDMTAGAVNLSAAKQPNDAGFYNGNVEVKVQVDDIQGDAEAYSGIGTIDYTIKNPVTKETETGNLYTFTKEKPGREDLLGEWTGSISVDAEKFNASGILVTVTARDNAENEYSDSLTLNICIDKPEITVKFEDTANRVVEERGYFAQERKALVTVEDRADAFDSDAFAEGFVVSAVDAAGRNIELEKNRMIGSWTHEGICHKAEITFREDGNYTWSLSYTNKADKACMGDEITYTGTTPQTFTVDQTRPSGMVTINENTWDKLLTVLTFGLYSKAEAAVSVKAEDATSPITVEYFKTNRTTAMTAEELDQQDFIEYKPFTVSKDEQFTVYLKVTDYAGKYVYISSDGYIVDMTPSEITITPEKANGNGIYNHDVKVNIGVRDAEPYSGIKTVTYEVKSLDKVTQSDTLYAFDMENPKQSDLLAKQDWTIIVDAEKNNSSNVTVSVKVTDNAGNESQDSILLDIDITQPAIEVTYGANDPKPVNIVGERGYFNNIRMATVTITERTKHFDKKAATENIKITAVDARGKAVKVDRELMVGTWITEENENPDAATHKAAIYYYADANYDVNVSYTDRAGNSNTPVNYGGSVTPEHFTVDTTPPVGNVAAKTKEKAEDFSEELVGSLTFGFWSRAWITVEGEAEDKTSPIAEMSYYKVSGEAAGTALTRKELEGITEWTAFSEKITVKENEQFVIYVKITDMAGHVTYISSNGMIVDSNKPKVETIAPKVTIMPEQPVNGIYNRDVKVKIKVEDPEAGNTYSGLQTIKYEVLNMGKKTQSGVLYSFHKINPKQDELKKTWSGQITVDSKLNNSNQVTIRVYAEDNAGNISNFSNKANRKTIKIDTTAPQISISYNNNSPDSGKYYQNDRVATITVTERNFDASDVEASIRNSDGSAPSITGWREVKGSGNEDDTKHIATITYHADGDYTFGINYTDLAGNRCPGASYAAGTSNPTEFTIDQTAPVITVSYDNNDVQNGKYFKENRTGTVTITEHNFDESRVEFTQTAALSGSPVTVPQASWSSSGDVHTATFVYDADGDYTFDVSMADMAGNQSGEVSYGDSAAGTDFTVDTGIEKPEITGVENGRSYKGDVIPAISYGDVNFAGEKILLLRTRKYEKDIDVTEEFITGLKENGLGASGINDTFAKTEENDGIYTLTVTVSDLAGNEETEKVIFTVNRFGSVYVFDDYLVSLKDAYTQKVENKLVITEYNPDRLIEDSLKIQITRDGTPLNNVKYTVTPVINDKVEVGESGWYQYEYEIGTENFTEDGIYKLAVASEDLAGNKPETTNFTEGDMLFHVDTTPAEITNVTGLENAIVNAESQTVNFDIFDAIGLKQVTIYVDDQKVGIYDKFEDLINYSGTVTVYEGTNQNVRLVVEDLAGNITDTDEKDENGKYTFLPEFAFAHSITVSTNAFVRWYANKLLFWGTIGGAAAAAAVLFLILFLKRRKKEEA